MPASPNLSAEEQSRYARHLVLAEIGADGQQKFKNTRVLVVGLGGLGSPAAMYLAAAGVGTLGLVDADTVSLSNLQRQIIYTTHDVGQLKVEVAAARLRAMNPHVQINLHPLELTADNALNIFADYDFILDGTDNFIAHYLINDAAILSAKPLVWGNVERFAGQVGIVIPHETACFRCLYPSPPPVGIAPTCAEIGVLGAVPGIIGSLQAMGILKLILGIGDRNKILRMDGEGFDFKTIQTARDEHCAICGRAPGITKLVSINAFCAINEITADELQQKLESNAEIFLLDVRNENEFIESKIEGAKLIPLPQLEQRLGELNPAEEIIIYCHSGKRSAMAAELLKSKGFQRIRTLKGGILAMQLSGHAA